MGGKCSMHGRDEKYIVYNILGGKSEVKTLADLEKMGVQYKKLS
jgi:hypothetical protein